LRNYLERCAIFEEPLPIGVDSDERQASGIDSRKPFDTERDRAIAVFEREYVQKVLELHCLGDGNRVRADA
jgi:two-component system, NtrC family, response regulator GlrR